MRAAREFAAFVLVSTAVHTLVLAGLPDTMSGGEAGSAGATAELSGADADIAALIRAWETPPETGRTRDLSAPEPVGAADTSDAQAALEAVEAGEATAGIADTTDPGPTPARPVMAALPTPDTTAPARLGMSMPAPSLSSPTADTGIDTRVARSGGNRGSMAALSPSVAAPSRPTAPPPEESMAPESAPLPVRRAEQPSETGTQDDARAESPQPPLQAPAPSAPGGAPDIPRQQAAAASAREPGAGGTSEDPLARYAARIRAAIDAAKRYPPAARLRGGEGEVVLHLTIDRDGSLRRSGVRSGSGDAALDEAALGAARSVARFPEAPRTLAGAPFDFVIPVRFEVN